MEFAMVFVFILFLRELSTHFGMQTIFGSSEYDMAKCEKKRNKRIPFKEAQTLKNNDCSATKAKTIHKNGEK